MDIMEAFIVKEVEEVSSNMTFVVLPSSKEHFDLPSVLWEDVLHMVDYQDCYMRHP